MLKYYLFLYLLLYLVQVFGQKTIIAKQGFEATQDNWDIESLSTEPCTQNDDSWNYHTELGDITPNEGSFFWGIKDLNGNCGSAGFEYIELSTINLTDYRNVILSFAIQVKGFDNGDDIKYQVWFDEIPQPEVLLIDGANNFSHDDWQLVQIEIPNSISFVKLRISFKQNGSDIAGLDNILLKGIPIEPCSDLMISEYLEGGSSTNYRNNYIELYNPSDSIIDLTKYQLVKYIGKNNEASAKMQLNGFIKPKAIYLIEDNTENLNITSHMSTNNSVMNFNGDDKISLTKNEQIIDQIGTIGDSTFFAKDITLRRKSHVQNPNTEFNIDEWDTYGFENTSDIGFHASYCEGKLPEIEVIANGQPLVDGDSLTSKVNHSYFGGWPISKDTIIERSFTIKNVGNSVLNIKNIILSGSGSDQFSINFGSDQSIPPKDSLQFSIAYNPQLLGIHTSKITIINTDPSESSFSYKIQGEGTGSVIQPLLISQYYEGIGNNKWIEITNISQQVSPINTYYLALFRNEATLEPIGRKPSSKKMIPSIAPGQSIKFSATLTTTAPVYAIDGQEIKTTVCSFTGDDIIIISTSDQESCWADRVDIIGNENNWGTDISMVRRYGCDAVYSNTGYQVSDWIISGIEAVDEAAPNANRRIGIHYSGLTVWKDQGWTNGKPDQQRKAIIEHNYNTAIHGELEACSLHIFKNANVSITANEYLEIQNNLINEGVLEVNHEGSLLVRDDNAIIENKGSMLIHKSTTELNPFDYTYWSSPIKKAQLEDVFWNSPQNSIHYFSTKNYEDLDKDGLDDNNNAWVRILGDMKIGRGYISMAPNTTPFQNIQQVTFDGIVNNGILEVPVFALTDTIADQHYWNLIGNPYPSAIDGELLLNHPNNDKLLSKTLYFWTHSTPAKLNDSNSGRSYTSDDYAMYTIGTGGIKATPEGKEPTKYISSCQGFFVEALKAGNVIFNNEMRTNYRNDNFFKNKPLKGSNDKKIWLNLTNQHGSFSQILIGFIEGATNDLDQNYDGTRLETQNHLNFYSISNNRPLAIQGLPKFIGNERIKLGFIKRFKDASILQISIDHITENFEGFDFFLRDNLRNKSHNLKAAPYFFSSEEIKNYDSRFVLEFRKSINTIKDSFNEKNRIIWQLIDNYLFVETKLKDVIKKLEIYDLNGRKIIDRQVNDDQVKINWSGLPSRGIFILRVKLKGSKTLISKIIP